MFIFFILLVDDGLFVDGFGLIGYYFVFIYVYDFVEVFVGRVGIVGVIEIE